MARSHHVLSVCPSRPARPQRIAHSCRWHPTHSPPPTTAHVRAHVHAGQNGGYGYIKLYTNKSARSGGPVAGPDPTVRRKPPAPSRTSIHSMHIPGRWAPSCYPSCPLLIASLGSFLSPLFPCGSRRQGLVRGERGLSVCGARRRRRRRRRSTIPGVVSLPPALFDWYAPESLCFLPVLNFELLPRRTLRRISIRFAI
jgi:hypothetical protein